jgi:hypothetical protein
MAVRLTEAVDTFSLVGAYDNSAQGSAFVEQEYSIGVPLDWKSNERHCVKNDILRLRLDHCKLQIHGRSECMAELG